MGPGLDARLFRTCRVTVPISRPRVHLSRGATLLRSLGDRWSLSIILSHLGLCRLQSKRLSDGTDMVRIPDRGWPRVGLQGLVAVGSLRWGFATLAEDDLALATALFREGVTIVDNSVVTPVLIDALQGLAVIARRRGHRIRPRICGQPGRRSSMLYHHIYHRIQR